MRYMDVRNEKGVLIESIPYSRTYNIYDVKFTVNENINEFDNEYMKAYEIFKTKVLDKSDIEKQQKENERKRLLELEMI